MKRLRCERKARKRDGETKRQNKQDKERERERVGETRLSELLI